MLPFIASSPPLPRKGRCGSQEPGFFWKHPACGIPPILLDATILQVPVSHLGTPPIALRWQATKRAIGADCGPKSIFSAFLVGQGSVTLGRWIVFSLLKYVADERQEIRNYQWRP